MSTAVDSLVDNKRTRGIIGTRFRLPMIPEVGAVRLELTASWSQTKRAADLRYAPLATVYSKGGERSSTAGPPTAAPRPLCICLRIGPVL
jgi:hypothetical protein